MVFHSVGVQTPAELSKIWAQIRQGAFDSVFEYGLAKRVLYSNFFVFF
ncbi:hypothetical protein [Siminovitchia terrae]|nr:hypothetical protein [Siminovitchia terrae]